jgi:hypothetical protein
MTWFENCPAKPNHPQKFPNGDQVTYKMVQICLVVPTEMKHNKNAILAQKTSYLHHTNIPHPSKKSTKTPTSPYHPAIHLPSIVTTISAYQ